MKLNKGGNMIATQSKVMNIGDVFGRYTVLGIYKEEGVKSLFAHAQCSCGSPPRYVRGDGLRNGTSKSCGCLQREATTKHGAWGKPLFNVWRNMITRCTNPKDKRYSRYGGRGIQVCDRWLNVNNFIADMTDGYEKGYQIDRINNDGNYEPSNCRWATTKQQTRNYSRNVVLEHDGKRLCAIDWADIVGIPAKTIYQRISDGWSAADALTKPINSMVKRSSLASKR